MIRSVAFLRAVNVGGRTVRMERLRQSFEALGLRRVATFIASGNVIFDSTKRAAILEPAIEARLQEDFGFTVAVMIRTLPELQAIQRHVAGRGLTATPGVALYVGLLKSTPAADAVSDVLALSNQSDRLSIEGRELYWQAAQGMGRSTLSGARIEQRLGVPATLRNVNTIDRIVARFGYS